MIRFVDVDPDNWRLGLKVAPSQKTHVADSATLLPRAYAYRNYNAYDTVLNSFSKKVQREILSREK